MATSKTDPLSELPEDEQSAQAKKARKAQAEQMFGNAEFHAPTTPTRADYTQEGYPPAGAPPAQGPNLSKEEEEFAAAALQNKASGGVFEEKIPAPRSATSEPLAEAGKEPK